MRFFCFGEVFFGSFIESLTHDSIIAQIPLLAGRTRNRLEKLLSVFDQDFRTPDDVHLLEINDDSFAGDDVQYLVQRLLKAAAAPKVRRTMEIEDEILSEIEAIAKQLSMPIICFDIYFTISVPSSCFKKTGRFAFQTIQFVQNQLRRNKKVHQVLICSFYYTKEIPCPRKPTIRCKQKKDFSIG